MFRFIIKQKSIDVFLKNLPFTINYKVFADKLYIYFVFDYTLVQQIKNNYGILVCFYVIIKRIKINDNNFLFYRKK